MGEVWTFAVGKPGADTLGRLKAQADRQSLKLIGEPVEFRIVIYQDTKPVKEFKHFGGTFVERAIELDEEVDGEAAAAFRYDSDKDELRYAPVRFETAGGKTTVVIKSTGDGAYAVAALAEPRTFRDVQGHWAEKEIAVLAARTIVNGVSAKSFAPGRSVTRAEFAAMLVRALGLSDDGRDEAGFSDVRSVDWYAESVAIAAQYGIVEGGTDGKFRPEETITREQMAVMASRALVLTATSVEATRVPVKLKDLNLLNSWSAESINLVLDAGIMQGRPHGVFAPEDLATRAEAAIILYRLIEAMRLI